jgi:hypothetical protein
MIAFIDDHREAHGVEPICRVLPIAPSTHHHELGEGTFDQVAAFEDVRNARPFYNAVTALPHLKSY